MEHSLNCHKPPFNEWENIYWRNSCHPYVDFCHSLLKVWLNIKMHHHNGSDFDKNSLHVRALLGSLCNIILECSSICICSRWLLDSNLNAGMLQKTLVREFVLKLICLGWNKGSKEELEIYKCANNIFLAFCWEIYLRACFSWVC